MEPTFRNKGMFINLEEYQTLVCCLQTQKMQYQFLYSKKLLFVFNDDAVKCIFQKLAYRLAKSK